MASSPPVATCQLCYGDEWISDSPMDFERCNELERAIFMHRTGKLSGVMEGRMVCPRCRPNG